MKRVHSGHDKMKPVVRNAATFPGTPFKNLWALTTHISVSTSTDNAHNDHMQSLLQVGETPATPDRTKTTNHKNTDLKNPPLPHTTTDHHIPLYKYYRHTKPATTITFHKEVDTAVQKALLSRLDLLPNMTEQQSKIGPYTKLHISTNSNHPQPATTPSDQHPPTKSNKGLIWLRGPALGHPAAPLLTSYAINGCPVDCGPDWSLDRIIQALTYGSHPSAKKTDA